VQPQYPSGAIEQMSYSLYRETAVVSSPFPGDKSPGGTP
jgi:hypothetical protein